MLQIFGKNLGYMHTGVVQQAGYLKIRAAVLMFGRGVHDDAGAAIGKSDAEVATKTGIGRSGSQIEYLAGEQLRNPVLKRLSSGHPVLLNAKMWRF